MRVQSKGYIRLTFSLIVVLFLFGLHPTRTVAPDLCLCLPARPKEAFNQATAVFSSEVATITPGPLEWQVSRFFPYLYTYPNSLRVTFQVDEVWKGTPYQNLVVSTPTYSCGYSFQVGKKFLVYASGSEDQLHTGLCSGTSFYSQSTASLAFLGRGQPAMVEGSNAPLPLTPEQVMLRFLGGCLGIMVVLLLAVWAILKRRTARETAEM